MLFYLDFETRSEVELKKVGALNYAASPTTEVTSIAYAINDGPVQHRQTPPLGGFPTSAVYVAHNIEFEQAILREKYDCNPSQWIDTMALAAHMSLPLSLEKLAAFFGYEKNMEGQRVMRKLSKPRRPSKNNKDLYWERDTKPDDFDLLDEYNQNDVEVMRLCHKRMTGLTKTEQKIWELTRTMNQRGIRVDLPALSTAIRLVDGESTALSAEMHKLTGCSPRSSKTLSNFLSLPNVKKETVEKALQQKSISPTVRQVLEWRQLLGRSSTAKLDTLMLRLSSDNRLRNSLVYSGAQRTGRWSSRGVQLQNLPRGLGKATDSAFNLMKAGALDLYDSPLKLMPEMIRGFFKGPFLVGDFAQIEARILAWLAGDKRQVEQWANGVDLYKQMAAKVYNKSEEEITSYERFVGKTIILGCGYGMGGTRRNGTPSKFYRTCIDKGINITEEFAQKAVNVYRDSYPAIVRYWYSTQEDFENGRKIFSKRIRDSIRFIHCHLPSGRLIYYANPEKTEKELRVFNPNKLGGPGMDKTYGGKLVENIVQATARDLMAEAMLGLDAKQFKLVLTVHDEIVAEDDGRLDLFKKTMIQTPQWADGLPIEAEVFRCERYRK